MISPGPTFRVYWSTPGSLSAAAILLAAAFCASCSSTGVNNPAAVKVEKPFAAAGNIEIQLDGGNYEVRPAAGDTIRVTFSGNSGNAIADLSTAGTRATLAIKNTPHNNFKATIEVPKASDLVLRLSGGDLDVGAITGNKDIDSGAGDVGIAANPGDYASVDATVKVGDLDGGTFGSADGSLSHHLAWSGHGKYTLRARLGAGDLKLK